MLCKECGSDVSSSEVFCPNCGAPLRVTADYDYIQAEIGVKVDQVMNDEPAEELPVIPDVPEKEADPDPGLNIIGDNSSKEAEKPKPSASSDAAREKENLANTIAVTRTLYVKDSIFADEEAPDIEEDEPKPVVNVPSRKNASRQISERKKRAAERAKKRKIRLILIIVAAIVVIGAVVGIIIATSGNKNQNETESDAADVITCSVTEGETYTTPMEVTLWSENDYRIIYTLDGSEPTISSGTKYGEPIEFTNKDVTADVITVTLIAYSYNNSIKSGEIRVNFNLTKSAVTAPSMDLASGDYYEATQINIFADEGNTIYYTYDGSTPTVNSTKYTGPIDMKRGNNILSAVAVDDSGVMSDVSTSVYNLVIQPNISFEEAWGNVMYTLQEQQLIESQTPNENGYYTVPGGGVRRVINGGEALVDNTNYYVIQVDYMNDGSNVQATTYYGVNDQTGEVIRLNRSGMSFVIG